MIGIECIELLNYRIFPGMLKIVIPARSQNVFLFLRTQGRSTIMRSMAWCLCGSESRSFLAKGGTNDNLPNFEVASSNAVVEVSAAVVLADMEKRYRFERSALYYPPDLSHPHHVGWRSGNDHCPPPEKLRCQGFMEDRDLFIPALVTGLHLIDLDFVRYLDNSLIDEHIVQLVTETKGRLDIDERDRIEASMKYIMGQFFGRATWSPTIGAHGEMERIKMNWSTAMMIANLSDFHTLVLHLLPALAMLDVYGAGVPLMVKASDTVILTKVWDMLNALFPRSQKIFVLPLSMKGTIGLLASISGWDYVHVVTDD